MLLEIFIAGVLMAGVILFAHVANIDLPSCYYKIGSCKNGCQL